MKAQRSSLPSRRMGRPAWHAGLVLVPLVVGALCGGVTELNAQAGTPVPQIVFVSPYRGTRQFFRVTGDGDGLQRLTSPPGDSEGPAWSEEGQRLLFVRSDGDNVQIYTASAGGMGLQRLTAPPGTHGEAAWSPDGHRIAYITRVAGVGHISLMNADGRDQRILSGPPASASAPAWSPDGRLIAFLARSKGSGAELYVTRGDAGGIRRIPTPATGVVPGVSEFVWLRDGQHIAYTTRAGPAQSDISLVGLDGAPPRWLAFGYAPSWSPDGRRVAFVVAHVGGGQIYVQDMTVGRSVPLTDAQRISLRPVWSPDGEWIAFLSVRGTDLGLWVMRADGSGQRRLAPAAGDPHGLPGMSRIAQRESDARYPPR